MQIYKYVVHNVAHQYGKTATFMPKPIKGDNGSEMHTRNRWKGDKPAFAGNLADLSETALYYIGGILRHAKALNAFTNPTTNSYKRLIPGFEAPVLLAYSARNRSAGCRIPIVSSPKAKRVEVRYRRRRQPVSGVRRDDDSRLDGIQNKIHPGDPMDKNLYDLPPEELKDIPTVCGCCATHSPSYSAITPSRRATSSVAASSIVRRTEWEVYNLEHTPHPVEFRCAIRCSRKAARPTSFGAWPASRAAMCVFTTAIARMSGANKRGGFCLKS
jgi:glutamine synthetase